MSARLRTLSQDGAWEVYCEAERAACEAAAVVLRPYGPAALRAIRDNADEAGSNVLSDVCSFVLGEKKLPDGWNVGRISRPAIGTRVRVHCGLADGRYEGREATVAAHMQGDTGRVAVQLDTWTAGRETPDGMLYLSPGEFSPLGAS